MFTIIIFFCVFQFFEAMIADAAKLVKPFKHLDLN